jgi:hypothetical protein
MQEKFQLEQHQEEMIAYSERSEGGHGGGNQFV